MNHDHQLRPNFSHPPPSSQLFRGPSKETHEAHVRDNLLWWGEDGHAKYPRLKIHKGNDGLVPIDLWHWQQSGTSDEGGATLKEIFGSAVFDNPKPVRLVRRMLQLATNPNTNDIVLDSCSGSGTTGHAVLEQNVEDDGNRTFVMVQQARDSEEDEKEHRNIVRQITAERIRRVALGYERRDQNSPGGRIAGLGGSFTYARVGDPLFGEYKNFGEKLPAWEEIARYVFYTETSHECDEKKFRRDTGFIGSTPADGGTAYYLLYTPNHKEDRELSLKTLAAIQTLEKKRSKSLVIYCERIWMHPDELRRFEDENKIKVRAMLVPFNLR